MRTAKGKARVLADRSETLTASDLHRIGRMSQTDWTRRNDGFAS